MTPVGFDFEDVLPTVQMAHSQATRDDAEDAVMTAVAEGLEKGWDLTARNVVACARFRLLNAKRRRDEGHLSLDAFAEDTEDQAPVEFAVDEVDFDAHVALSDPVTEARRRALEAGCRSPKGWTPETILAALRHVARVKGRPPAYRDLIDDPTLPHPNSFKRYYPTLNEALEAAGLRPRDPLIDRDAWTADEVRPILQRWIARHRRLPTAEDLRNATSIGLPAQMVFYRLFGSCSRETIAEAAFGPAAARVVAAARTLRERGRGQDFDLAEKLTGLLVGG